MQQEMEYIWRVYQEKSFSRAAESLYVTQPALSVAVRKVEETLGMPIFDRSMRPLGLTPAGEVYLEFIRKAKYLEQDLQQQIQDIRDVTCGSIRVGGTHYINAYLMPDALAGFAAAYPGVKIDLIEASSSALAQMLEKRELDLTFNCNPEYVQNFERYRAFDDRLLLAVPKSSGLSEALAAQSLSAADIIAGRHLQPDCPAVELDLFCDLEFILLNPGNNLHSRAEQMFQDAGFRPRVKMELSQMVTAYHLANSSVAATFVSDRIVSPDKDNLYYFNLDSEITARTFYMLLPNGKYASLAVRAFIAHLQANMK